MTDVCRDAILSPDASRRCEPTTRFGTPIAIQGCAAEQLRRTEKAAAIGHLAGGLAHDFNNLLSVVVGNLERTSRLLPAGTNASQCVADAMTATDRAVALVCRLLAFARNQPLVPQLIEVDRLLFDLKPLLDVAAPGCAIKLDLDCPWLGLVDANQLENVVLNLAVNARDAMAGSGRLTIVTRRSSVLIDMGGTGCLPRDYIELEIRDTGAGMSSEVRARATEPFFTTKSVELGTGLGLSQVADFATQCGGTIQIASEVGKGTSVTLRIPRATHASGPAARP